MLLHYVSQKLADVSGVFTLLVVALMMEAVSTSETSAILHETTWRNIQEHKHIHTCSREHLKSKLRRILGRAIVWSEVGRSCCRIKSGGGFWY
jgi:hypothetical protein